MEFVLNPDRERMELALVMALLVNGRTVFEDFSFVFICSIYKEYLDLTYLKFMH